MSLATAEKIRSLTNIGLNNFALAFFEEKKEQIFKEYVNNILDSHIAFRSNRRTDRNIRLLRCKHCHTYVGDVEYQWSSTICPTCGATVREELSAYGKTCSSSPFCTRLWIKNVHSMDGHDYAILVKATVSSSITVDMITKEWKVPVIHVREVKYCILTKENVFFSLMKRFHDFPYKMKSSGTGDGFKELQLLIEELKKHFVFTEDASKWLAETGYADIISYINGIIRLHDKHGAFSLPDHDCIVPEEYKDQDYTIAQVDEEEKAFYLRVYYRYNDKEQIRYKLQTSSVKILYFEKTVSIEEFNIYQGAEHAKNAIQGKVFMDSSVKKSMESGFLKYSGLKEALAKLPEHVVWGKKQYPYIVGWLLNPNLETLIKAGYEHVVAQLLDVSVGYALTRRSHGSNPQQILSLPKRLLPLCKNAEITVDEIDRLYTINNLTNDTLSIKMYEKARESFSPCQIEEILKVLEYYPQMRFEKTIAYVRELPRTQYIPAEEAISFYIDYIKLISKTGEAPTKENLYPSRLRFAHDKAVFFFNLKQDEEKSRKMQAIYENNKRLEFSSDKFTIIIPKESKELIDEGKAMHHCVGSYVDDVMAGRKTIAFLRKTATPEKSFITIEVNLLGEVRQIKKSANRQVSSDEIDLLLFLGDWMDEKELKLDSYDLKSYQIANARKQFKKMQE